MPRQISGHSCTYIGFRVYGSCRHHLTEHVREPARGVRAVFPRAELPDVSTAAGRLDSLPGATDRHGGCCGVGWGGSLARMLLALVAGWADGAPSTPGSTASTRPAPSWKTAQPRLRCSAACGWMRPSGRDRGAVAQASAADLGDAGTACPPPRRWPRRDEAFFYTDLTVDHACILTSYARRWTIDIGLRAVRGCDERSVRYVGRLPRAPLRLRRAS